MKMAKASEADLRAALDMCSAMENLSRGYLPEQMQEPDSEESERYDYRQHAADVVDCLIRIANRGSLFRVCFGMTVLLDPINECVDPDADTLETHPKVLQTEEQRDELAAALIECRGSVKFDMNRYERMALDYSRLGPEWQAKHAIAESEAERLHKLIDTIDALAKLGAGRTAE